ncbi:hypothetical protein BBK36DRAFT_1157318 [Trichoderma citrinoviride]|uniref:Fucose-specific lectin n=1 Tax=Trichoderma citrinoviride TaxID=58853 RepID=A0A2T4BID4_9HYPO|nr:hypothetical protein BBK36DRAFT_1157318 [Trichoderma citrinoviride]PTB69077.1 hypothetical protein BBK36DRAFT_1157318 [Trichoderma citrinoviride]
MMPIFDVAYFVQRDRQAANAAAGREPPPIPPRAPRATRSMEDQQPHTAREQYYQLHRDPVQRPWYYRKRMLPFAIAMTIISTLLSCVMLAVTLTRKSFLMMKAHPTETVTQSALTMATYSTTFLQESAILATATGNSLVPLPTTVSGLPSVTAATNSTASPSARPVAPILSSSDLASAFVDQRDSRDSWGILVWQDGAGSLAYTDGDSERKGLGRIRDVLQDAATAKYGTPMAAVVDDADIVHLFYLDERSVVSHVFMTSGGSWKVGGLSTGTNRMTAHEKSKLSAAFHQGEHDTNVVVLSYQDPDGKLQLAMSEEARKTDWHVVDFSSFAGRHEAGDWGGIGHAIAGDWQNKRQESDGSFSGLLLAVEKEGEIMPWECSVDFHASSTKQVECHVLDKIFLDSKGEGISPSSRTNQLAWIRTGHGQGKAPAQTLPYEFALLYADSRGSIQESRVGVDVERVSGDGFHGDVKFDSLATNGNRTVYAKSGSNVVVFRLDDDGWQWRLDGIVNTTISETDS